MFCYTGRSAVFAVYGKARQKQPAEDNLGDPGQLSLGGSPGLVAVCGAELCLSQPLSSRCRWGCVSCMSPKW
jgi:hypothetical protein